MERGNNLNRKLIIFTKIKAFLSPPTLTNENLSRKAKVLNQIWLNFIVCWIIFIIIALIISPRYVENLALFLSACFYLLIIGALKHKGKIHEASFLFIITTWTIFSIIAFISQGFMTVLSSFYTAIIIMAGILLGKRYAFWLSFLTLLVAFIYILIDSTPFKLPEVFVMFPLGSWSLLLISFVSIIIPITISVQNNEESLHQSLSNQLKIKEFSDNLEKIVKSRTEELENSNKDLHLYSYAITHDIRNPLTNIDLLLDLTLEQMYNSIDHKTLENWTKIKQNVEQMKNLIEDLMKLFLINKQSIDKKTFSVNVVVQKVIDSFEFMLKDKKIEFNVQPLKDCYADEILITQVWSNLISNSIKFCRNKPNPYIEIGLKQEDDESIYYIKDNGIGFDEDHSDELFNVFGRLHNQDNIEGSGIGLAFVKRILVRHGGKIWVESKVDIGTTFYFTIH
jgi:signal transduction histidine kinase